MAKESDINILLVDDDAGIRKTLGSILRDQGYKVWDAVDGATAIAIAKERFFNLALIDIKLPDMNGIEVLEVLKEINKQTSMLIITAYAALGNAVEALNKGAFAYLIKPLNVDEMLISIEKAIEMQRLSVESKKLHKELKKAYDRLKNSYLTTLKTLAQSLELRDPYTRKHSSQVCKYSIQIAKELNLSQQKVKMIKNTCLLHDLGKIGISDFILRKKGKLTKKEWEIMKKHPIIGESFIDPLLLFHVEQSIIRHHHERYDGKGYPDGLAGKNIPFSARILAVADAYDAMISKRPYRRALLKKKAIAELKANSGTQFDPEIVDAFLRSLKKEKINKKKR